MPVSALRPAMLDFPLSVNRYRRSWDSPFQIYSLIKRKTLFFIWHRLLFGCSPFLRTVPMPWDPPLSDAFRDSVFWNLLLRIRLVFVRFPFCIFSIPPENVNVNSFFNIFEKKVYKLNISDCCILPLDGQRQTRYNEKSGVDCTLLWRHLPMILFLTNRQ